MECPSEISPLKESHDGSNLQSFQLESVDRVVRSDSQFRSSSALDILRETVRILRFNSGGFIGIAALLICPFSAVFLSGVFVEPSIVKRIAARLLILAKSNGLPLKPLTKQLCYKFSEMAVLSATCFPLYITLLLLSKAAVVYSVDGTYSRKKFNPSKFFSFVTKIWKRLVSTTLWGCALIAGCLALLVAVLLAVSSLFSALGLVAELIVYPAIVMGFVFSVIFVNAIIICNVATVVSVLEDLSGSNALVRSSSLIRGQTQVGLLMFLGSAIGMAFVEFLFEHRVKTVSYGDGSSRLWEGPLLVLMHAFILLIDSMMITVFYFSCRSHSMEPSNGECQPDLEAVTSYSGSVDIE
ncbi:hypothetical protein NMG60_11036135 [Bertholletia excelsa]